MVVGLRNRAPFGFFVLDLRAGELRKGKRKIVLQEQPFQILRMLVVHRGELVTLGEIRKALWPNNTVVEFNHSIHTAIKKLRKALGDSADAPRYVETVARRGYRLMQPVEFLAEAPASATPDAASGDPSPNTHSASTADPKFAAAGLIGKRVSHYRVLDLLGGGGMGVVYRAEDIRLGRRVALKFLPEELAANPVALGRFEQEARAASALDHPNICTIYEVEEHQGQPFIVMQLLEGHTLRECIAASGGSAPFGTKELVDLAIQIAEGLDAAQQKGIIHRDIKPANIFVTKRGEVKILDFGLAKLIEIEPVVPVSTGDAHHSAPPADAPSTPSNLTRTGETMGTACYMSPEQVRGEPLDTRSDLFSFGLALYEMATGRQAFAGHTAALVHDAIVRRTPVPARELNPELPPKLDGIINKALEKNREVRYQAASDIWADLQGLRPVPKAAPLRRRWVYAGAFAMLLAATALFWFTQRQPSSTGVPELKQRQLTTNSTENAVATGAISPDGKYLAYSDLKGIHIKLLETGETHTVQQPEALKGVQVNWGIVPTWVRDGASLIANASVPSQRPSIWTVPTMGGPPRKLRGDAFALTISRDGAWVAFTTNPGRLGDREMWIMRPDGGQARRVRELTDGSGIAGAEWSPDGQRLSYVLTHQAGDGIETVIETRGLRGGSASTVLPSVIGDLQDHSWSPDGRVIYSLSDPGPLGESCNYWAIRLDARTGKPLEQLKRLTNWAGFCMDSTSATADGKQLAFRKWSWRSNVYVADLEAGGTRITNPARLTVNEARNYPGTWTADNKAIVFASYLDGQWRILKQPVGQDTAETIVAGVLEDVRWGAVARVSPDGAWVLYFTPSSEHASSTDPRTPVQLMRVPIAGGPPKFVLTAHTTDEVKSQLICAKSPASLCVISEPTMDQKQLIFTAFDAVKGRDRELARFDTDPHGVYRWDLSSNGTRLAALKYSEGRIHILSLGGQAPQEIVVKGWNSLQSVNWAADGKALFASSATAGGSALLHLSLQGNAHVLWEQKGSIAPWSQPDAQNWLGGPSAPWAVPSPDGRRLAIYDWKLSANMWMMENF